MAYVQLQKEVAQLKLEIQIRRVHRELSLMALILKWPASEWTNSLEEFILTREASARIGIREQKDKTKNFENTTNIGRWHPSECRKLEASKVADPSSSRSNVCRKFHGERIAGQELEMKIRDKSKAALRFYRCQGIGHFARKCPAQRRRRRSTRNSPGKGNPSERAISHEAKLNTRC
jgi:CRISPR/Cas system-associated endonuclease/helicase Cas3